MRSMPNTPIPACPIRCCSARRVRSSCRPRQSGDRMRLLVTLHRWWGVAFCLLFAMWFASGIVMHFVPFPTRSASAVPPPAIDPSGAGVEPIDYDQGTVAGDSDHDRPLKRIALNDDHGTEISLSAATGAVVLSTTRTQRLLNYVGSIAHWLYPTELRRHK